MILFCHLSCICAKMEIKGILHFFFSSNIFSNFLSKLSRIFFFRYLFLVKRNSKKSIFILTASKKYASQVDNHKANEDYSLVFSRNRKDNINKYDSLEVFVIVYDFCCNFCIFNIFFLKKNICNRFDTFKKFRNQ